MSQAYYLDTLEKFLNKEDDSIIGVLSKGQAQFSQQWGRATISWQKSVEILKRNVEALIQSNNEYKDWTILFEYEVPRLLSRIDTVILANDIIFVIEYKDDRKEFLHQDLMQVEDYALDLKDFHLQSRERIIVPILLAPLANKVLNTIVEKVDKFVQPTLKCNSDNLSPLIGMAYQVLHNDNLPDINVEKWVNSDYSPTPTIIQAAQVLFSGHSVDDITKKGADAYNLSNTIAYLTEQIRYAQKDKRKIVCFVTGVPGAGKTLVGLDLIHKMELNEIEHYNAAYFSGNGPLISVLREALAQDEFNRENARFKDKVVKTKPRKKDSHQKIKTKIQNLHRFIKDGIREKTIPNEKVVIFDEAQRCWSAQHFYNQTKQNQNREKEENRFDPIMKSEAEVLFEIMDKHEDWAVIIALVGGGQEINTGEAGIEEWGNVLIKTYNHWDIHISPELLTGDSSTAGHKLLKSNSDSLKIHRNEYLHLAVSQRTFRANNINEWVNALLDNDSKKAKEIYNTINDKYPIYLTRDLNSAKGWLKNIKQGSKRIGLIASSGAQRLRPYGISTKETIDEAMWFLNDEQDVRSSNFLELAATEFGIQGLEIDWSCLCWDCDFRRLGNNWDYRNFSGTSWKQVDVENIKEKQYILNTYRVLLTRAREGLVIWIPAGSNDDQTRLPEFYDPIFDYLKSCGIQEL